MHSETARATTRLSVIGLGRMGLPIARHLDRAGYPISVYDRDPRARRRATEVGLTTDASAGAVAEGADVLLTVLPGASEFEDAMLGADQVVHRLRRGSCWLDLSSNDPRVAERVAAISADGGVHSVAAPMVGGVEAAETATLEFYVGGPAAARNRVAQILEVLARPGGVKAAGETIGSGYSVKLLINLLWFGQVAAVSEAMLLGRRLGIPPARFRDLLAGSAGDSSFAQRHLDRLLDGDYAETFGLRECVDELDVLTGLAADRGSPFELSSVVARLHHEALDRFGAVDGEMLVAKLLEERDGEPLNEHT